MPAMILPSSVPIGSQFGRLTTTGTIYRKIIGIGPRWHVACRCSCGDTREYALSPLKNGNTRSCGCLKSERSRETCAARRKWLPLKDDRIRRIWISMKRRCCDPKHEHFDRYGGRGINICKSWLESYPAFREWAVNHPAYREGLTIERMDNDKDYTSENCTWIPGAEQAFNRSTTRYFEYQGERKRLSQWMKDPRCLAPSLIALQRRINKWGDFGIALTTPFQRPGSGKAKVTEDKVREIRAEYAAGNVLQSELAERHNIRPNTISEIVNRKTWTHVE
jgi:hypothetical protein